MAPSTIKNTAYQEDVIDIMKTGLLKVSLDVIILFDGWYDDTN